MTDTTNPETTKPETPLAKQQGMVRTNYYFPAPMLAQLRERSTTTGFTVSEIIRTAVSEYLKTN